MCYKQDEERERIEAKHEHDAERCLRALLIALDLDPLSVDTVEGEETPDLTSELVS